MDLANGLAFKCNLSNYVISQNPAFVTFTHSADFRLSCPFLVYINNCSHSHSNTLENSKDQYFSHGHADMLIAGVKDRTTDLPVLYKTAVYAEECVALLLLYFNQNATIDLKLEAKIL